jgi:hypothetical protein
MINQNVYNRMQRRGADFNDPRVWRRLQNRSFQADQGTLKKGSWTNKDAMRGAYEPLPGQPQPSQPQRGRPDGSNSPTQTLASMGASVPMWKQQRMNGMASVGNAGFAGGGKGGGGKMAR